ncbi:MAG: hypothetical protein ACTHM6_04755 [Tepidisphaeraceae bacterium]
MRHTRSIAAVALVLSAVAPAWAVKTQYWTQTTADDFNKGTLTNLVATNHGQLRLSRDVDALLPKDKHVDAIQALAEAPDGGIVFSAFPDGEVLKLKDGKLQSLAKFENQTITSLAYDAQGRLLIGVGGEKAQLVRLDKPGAQPETLFEEEGVRYIWSIVPQSDKLLLATGPTGGVYEVDANKQHKRLAQLSGDNVLCLLAGHDGTLYAGCDKEGLVYRIDPKSDKPYILLNAPEEEISALAFDSAGNLLAATSDASASGTPAAEAKSAPGKPDKQQPSSIPSKKPDAPKLPDESPGDAIPRNAAAVPEPHDDQAGPDTTRPTNAMAAPPVSPDQPAAAQSAGAQAGAAGNAVYRIDGQGFVTELFRAPVVIYGMAVQGDSIFLTTGTDGGVYEIRPKSEESTLLLRTDAPDVTAILPAKDGSLLLATSNAGQILKLSANCAPQGVYESDVLDAGMVSRFGTMHLLGTMPKGTEITVSTRAGNIDDPDDDGWSDWSDPQPASEFTHLTSSPARYLQYRLAFKAGDDHQTPTVDEVTTAYQRPNVGPHITSVTVAPTGDPQNPGNMTIAWEAADPNDDELRYSVYVREVGKPAWMKLASDLSETSHVWSARGTADGHYEVKVVASDAAANLPGQGKESSRISESVLIDNTPPLIGDIKTDVSASPAPIKLRAVDRTGTVASLDYTVDSVDHWQRSLPDDTIADSPEERYTLSLPGLGKGQHTVLVKVTDERGNASLQSIGVNVP